MSIPLIQSLLKEEKLQGWLLYDFHGLNPIFGKVVGKGHITRRAFYWIPVEGSPWKIVHKIEAHVLDGVEGELKVYARREELQAILERISGRVAMEYSQDIPYVSFVDGGTIDTLKGMEIVSSGRVIQRLSILDKEGIASHLVAADVLDRVVNEAFQLARNALPYEKEVEQFIVRRFAEEGCVTNHPPIVACGANSANPHYMPKGKGDKIKK